MSSHLKSLYNVDLAEEIEAINAIYDPDTITLTSSSSSSSTSPIDLGNSSSSTSAPCTTIKLQIPNHPHLSFLLIFDNAYPDTPPKILGTASTASRGEGKIAVDVLEDILERMYTPGAVCLFDVINEATETFEELRIGGETTVNDETTNVNPEDNSKPEDLSIASLSLHSTLGLPEPPNWILSEVITEKKSVFVGRAAHVTGLDQAQKYLDYLLASDKKVASATHNISAWRIRQKSPSNQNPDQKGGGGKGGNGGEMIVQDCDDDGETAAGGRLLHLMQLMDVWDVVVVVTRWYGGVLLGPDRFRIINAAGRDALVRGGFAKEGEKGSGGGGGGGGEKGKRKGKK